MTDVDEYIENTRSVKEHVPNTSNRTNWSWKKIVLSGNVTEGSYIDNENGYFCFAFFSGKVDGLSELSRIAQLKEIKVHGKGGVWVVS